MACARQIPSQELLTYPIPDIAESEDHHRQTVQLRRARFSRCRAERTNIVQLEHPSRTANAQMNVQGTDLGRAGDQVRQVVDKYRENFARPLTITVRRSGRKHADLIQRAPGRAELLNRARLPAP